MYKSTGVDNMEECGFLVRSKKLPGIMEQIIACIIGVTIAVIYTGIVAVYMPKE